MGGDFGGQVAIVTGAASGIGASIVQQFLAGGAKVTAVDIDGDRLAATHPAHPDLQTIVEDLCDAGAADRIVSKAIAHHDRLDILVNNAGSAIFCPVCDMNDDLWNWHHELNLNAPFRLCRSAVPEMIRRGGGRIVNITSVNAWSTRPGLAGYSSAKAGLSGFTRALATELGPSNITANHISPGPVRTEIMRRYLEEAPEREASMAGETALERIADPIEIAHAVLFLASKAASFITGAELVVDGGNLVKM